MHPPHPKGRTFSGKKREEGIFLLTRSGRKEKKNNWSQAIWRLWHNFSLSKMVQSFPVLMAHFQSAVSKCKRNNRIAEDLKQIKEAGREENPLVTRAYKAVQCSLQFIRWLRDELMSKSSWRSAIEGLRPLMVGYLT
ncbi:hypothetical protein BVX99_00705 [bacterium F16]|nr:hypothetical protein BVX99_00705 [bacterium F16]